MSFSILLEMTKISQIQWIDSSIRHYLGGVVNLLNPSVCIGLIHQLVIIWSNRINFLNPPACIDPTH